MNTSKTPSSPVKAISIAFIANWTILVLMGWMTFNANQNTKITTSRCIKLKELQGMIIHLDEVLTMSARMAAITGNVKWEERYTINEALLDDAIKQAILLAPNVHNDSLANKTNTANIELVKIEHQVFDLVHLGHLTEALSLLESDNYKLQKNTYSEGMDELTTGLSTAAIDAFKHQQKMYNFQILIIWFFLTPLLIICWIYLVRAVRHWKTTLSQRVDELQNEIIERKQHEKKLAISTEKAKIANHSKSEFLANMSHEIRTPMTAIMGYSEVVLENATDQDNIDNLKIIQRNGQHLLGIVNDILDLSKIESGHAEIKNVDCSPVQILSEVTSLMQVRADAKGLELGVEYAGPIPQSIQSDPTRLRQILINLVGNAIKFTEIGDIRLIVRLLNPDSNDSKLKFDIVDQGIGMTEDQIDRLFKPFSQADTSTTRKFGGTGLGLTISKRFAEMLGGNITVQSEFGQGSTFSFVVSTGPLKNVKLVKRKIKPRYPVRQVDRQPDPTNIQLNCRVLLAEDGPDNQTLISFVLKKAGAEVTVAENGQIAHDLVLKAWEDGTPFDVILMDMQMPVMDGYEATQKLRSEGYTGPIIALTAHTMSGDREKCLDAGCDDYTTKPIDREKLIWFVDRYATQHDEEQIIEIGNG